MNFFREWLRKWDRRKDSRGLAFQYEKIFTKKLGKQVMVLKGQAHVRAKVWIDKAHSVDSPPFTKWSDLFNWLEAMLPNAPANP